jgi:hypothetical protein
MVGYRIGVNNEGLIVGTPGPLSHGGLIVDAM